MGELVENSCAQFAAALASKAPVPGGGGAAALAGALGAALCSMVGQYTLGKPKYAAAAGEVEQILARCEHLRERLLELVDEDAAAFRPLSRAYAIPRDDPGRADILERATAGACQAPAEMVRCCGEVIALLREMLDKGSVMLVSDVGCGALLARAAMESAAMNVYVNTKSLRERPLAQALERETDALLARYLPLADETAAAVTRRLRGGA